MTSGAPESCASPAGVEAGAVTWSAVPTPRWATRAPWRRCAEPTATLRCWPRRGASTRGGRSPSGARRVGGVTLPHPLIVAAGLVKGDGFASEAEALAAVARGRNIVPGWRSLPTLVGRRGVRLLHALAAPGQPGHCGLAGHGDALDAEPHRPAQSRRHGGCRLPGRARGRPAAGLGREPGRQPGRGRPRPGGAGDSARRPQPSRRPSRVDPTGRRGTR